MKTKIHTKKICCIFKNIFGSIHFRKAHPTSSLARLVVSLFFLSEGWGFELQLKYFLVGVLGAFPFGQGPQWGWGGGLWVRVSVSPFQCNIRQTVRMQVGLEPRKESSWYITSCTS